MKFSCERSILLNEIAFAQEIVASKNMISILSNIYLEAGGNILSIRATNLKVYFETKVPVAVIEPGATSVFGDKFLGVLNSVPDGELEFKQSESKMTIRPTFKKIKFQLKSVVSDDYPDFPVPVEEGFFTLPARDFKQMIAQTVFAVSNDETRYYMNGIFFEKRDGKFIMVSTNSRRLSYSDKTAGYEVPDIAGVIILPKILNIITKRMSNEGMVEIAVSEKNLFIRFGAYYLSSLLIEGQFPNYQRVIPESQAFTFVAFRLEMLDAIKRISLLAEKLSKRIHLKIEQDAVSVFTEETDMGNAEESIMAEYTGERVDVALNYAYLEDALKAIDTEKFSFCFTDPMKAITLKAEPEQNYFHIIMPMSV
jgi:DNA polymerase-3 subunit beta